MNLLALPIGNFHPVLVHLPIGAIMLVAFLEGYGLWKPEQHHKGTVRLILWVSFITSGLSLVTGWILGNGTGYESGLLDTHRWLAVAFTIVNGLALYFQRKSNKILYGIQIVLALVLITLTGHYGGSMTHGEDFLTAKPASDTQVITDVSKAQVYADIVQPILDAKCVGCHNPKKIKGGLDLSTLSGLRAGGDNGSVLDSLQGKMPLLGASLHVPLDSDAHMPPKGKVQLSPEEIALLDWWATHGHCTDCQAGNLAQSPKMAHILGELEQDTTFLAVLAQELAPFDGDELTELQSQGVSVYPLAEGNPLLRVSLAHKKDLDENSLSALKPLAEHIVELDLGYSNFNDTISGTLKRFKNLVKLQLQQTDVNAETLKVLSRLPHLESLNLYGTDLDSTALTLLEKMKALRSLYLWDSQGLAPHLTALSKSRPNLVLGKIHDSVFAASSVEPPLILASGNFFTDTVQVQLQNFFEGVNIHYTTDGTEPDTTSTQYEGQLVVDKSLQLKAIAHKRGWALSEVAQERFTQIKYPAEVTGQQPQPHEKYPGTGAQTLADRRRGTINFVDGKWMGFEGTHATTTLKLEKGGNISSVSIGALSTPSNWIFFPTGATVWTSVDGENYTQVAHLDFPKEKPNTNVRMDFFPIEFPSRQANYVRVRVKSPLRNPNWHPNPGGKSWIFLDEIVIN
ncbi:FN3 associated domain-containing protein [Sediminicola luteus]|uniref:Uncharacterized protein n=1 Tax=Sediminicola luteus TaxID=319238 RepID=A0A2A4GD08_9FLAO|nr:chitobiase/beta-hexosaminidase C-terminal domain-containing protein [Sediminicola luteus]PCE66497.1 hypothetical protein B7P33_04160 [Sediminicola luteus]